MNLKNLEKIITKPKNSEKNEKIKNPEPIPYEKEPK